MKKIAIIPNDTKDTGLVNAINTAKLFNGRAEVFAEDKFKGMIDDVTYLPYDELFNTAEYMIALGGDGTMLQIAPQCAKKDIPVLGINLGRVGFLTEIELDNIDYAINKLLDDDYGIEKRMLIRMEIIKNGATAVKCHALNDVVVAKNAGAKLIKPGLYANGELVNKYIADGLIIATPTGSTGYSISAGGPVVDPGMELYVATPICAHTLSVRSAVLPADKEIIIRLDKDYLGNSAVVTADGDTYGSITTADEVRITKSKHQFSIIKIGKYSLYDTVLKKLS